MQTCTWAPTVFTAPAVVGGLSAGEPPPPPTGAMLRRLVADYVARIEASGVTHLLIPQRWWGSGQEMEGSSLDCLAMTAWIAALTERLSLITAIHPGFMQPTAVAKWGATLDNLTDGRWSINLTSGWHLTEFAMYGIPPLEHDARYARTAEFAMILRQAWSGETVDFKGDYYQVDGLRLEPRPRHALTVYQGGQSPAALKLAAHHSDVMFLNGGAPEKIAGLIGAAREACRATGRQLRFALYAAPLCRATDSEAWADIDERLARVDPALVAKRRSAVAGAEGMWSGSDPLSSLDTNEGYASRLIGSPETILERIHEFRRLGVDMLHLDLRDSLFVEQVLPQLAAL